MFDQPSERLSYGGILCQKQCSASNPHQMSTTVMESKPAGPAQQYKLVLNPAWWAQHARSATSAPLHVPEYHALTVLLQAETCGKLYRAGRLWSCAVCLLCDHG